VYDKVLAFGGRVQVLGAYVWHVLAAQRIVRSVNCTVPSNPVTNSARVGDADASAETTSAAAPARRNLGAARNAAAGPQHSLIVAVAVHHPDSIERRVRPCRSLSFALVGDLVA
jgi:hypothetical protein